LHGVQGGKPEVSASGAHEGPFETELEEHANPSTGITRVETTQGPERSARLRPKRTNLGVRGSTIEA
jgi:hypothetical protein